MENYENLMDELTRLNIQKGAVIRQIHEIETKLNKLKEERAAVLYNEILERISEIESLDFRFDVALWNNAIGEYEWYELETRTNLRYRHKDEVIID